MQIHEAVMRCQQDARLVMVSLDFDIFQVNRTGGVYQLKDGKARYARFKAADLVSSMWRTFTLDQLQDPEYMRAQG